MRALFCSVTSRCCSVLQWVAVCCVYTCTLIIPCTESRHLAHVNTCVYECTYVCMYVCVYICKNIYAHIYAHIHVSQGPRATHECEPYISAKEPFDFCCWLQTGTQTIPWQSAGPTRYCREGLSTRSTSHFWNIECDLLFTNFPRKIHVHMDRCKSIHKIHMHM